MKNFRRGKRKQTKEKRKKNNKHEREEINESKGRGSADLSLDRMTVLVLTRQGLRNIFVDNMHNESPNPVFHLKSCGHWRQYGGS